MHLHLTRLQVLKKFLEMCENVSKNERNAAFNESQEYGSEKYIKVVTSDE